MVVTSAVRNADDRFAQLAARAPRLRVLNVVLSDHMSWASAFVQLRELHVQVQWHPSGDRCCVALAPLTSLVHLKTLAMQVQGAGEPLLELTPLAKLTTLTTLMLCRFSEADLAPLAALTKLTLLDMRGTKVQSTSVAPLATLRTLEQLDVRGSGVTNVSPLVVLPRLRRLTVDDGVVDGATIAATFPALQFLGQGDWQLAAVDNYLETLAAVDVGAALEGGPPHASLVDDACRFSPWLGFTVGPTAMTQRRQDRVLFFPFADCDFAHRQQAPAADAG